MKIEIKEIKQLCLDVLKKHGVNDEDSEIIVEEYMYGQLSGKKSHGFMAFPKVLTKLSDDLHSWKITKEDETYALIDAKGAIGQLAGKFAMDLAISKAKKKGISLVGMNNMYSYLMPGYYAKMAAEHNMIGVVIDNALSRVAPYGGVEPKLGTNPIGLSIPTRTTPFILDMATSIRAMGEVRLAKKLGGMLPEGMAMDKDGKSTTDPNEVNALNSIGGYKGYGLALAIEILAGAFVLAKMSSNIKEPLDRGFLFLVINPEIFVDIESFKQEVSALFSEIKSSKKAEGVDEILIPGERAQKAIKQNLDNGYIELEDAIIDDIKNLL